MAHSLRNEKKEVWPHRIMSSQVTCTHLIITALTTGLEGSITMDEILNTTTKTLFWCVFRPTLNSPGVGRHGSVALGRGRLAIGIACRHNRPARAPVCLPAVFSSPKYDQSQTLAR